MLPWSRFRRLGLRRMARGCLGLLLLIGCATPQQRQTRHDWHTLCINAPFVAGMEISYAEQRAMTRLKVWGLSVEEINARCAK